MALKKSAWYRRVSIGTTAVALLLLAALICERAYTTFFAPVSHPRTLRERQNRKLLLHAIIESRGDASRLSLEEKGELIQRMSETWERFFAIYAEKGIPGGIDDEERRMLSPEELQVALSGYHPDKPPEKKP